jgi:hypothetical protein
MPAVGAALTALGLSFTSWARVHLGRNWSGTVTLKDDHALIRTGPYRRVRHPIYSGALLALAGTVLAVGQWRGVIALALVSPSCAGFGWKKSICARSSRTMTATAAKPSRSFRSFIDAATGRCDRLTGSAIVGARQ